MATASSLVYRLDPPVRAVLAVLATAWFLLALLVFVASLLDPAIPGPSLEETRVAPFRWRGSEGLG